VSFGQTLNGRDTQSVNGRVPAYGDDESGAEQGLFYGWRSRRTLFGTSDEFGGPSRDGARVSKGHRVSGHVFISYSRTDTPYVERLVAHLGAAGVPVWVDHKIDHGDRWASVIEAQIESCSAFVPVMTPEAAASEWVEREVHLAQQLGKPILPLLLAGRPFFRLATTQHDDVTGAGMPSAKFIERLVGHMGTRSAAPATMDVSLAWGHDVGGVWSLAYSPTGRELATGGVDGVIRVWNTYTGESLRSFAATGGPVLDIAYSPGGRQFATGTESGPVHLQDVYDGELIRTLTGHDAHASSLAYSPTGRHLVTGSNDGTARVWDVASGATLVTFSDHEDLVACVSYSPDGRHVASVSYDDTARVWSATDGSPVRVFPQEGLLQATAYSPDGRLATGGDDATVLIWDPTAGTVLVSLEGRNYGVESLAFSPDGRFIAGGSGWSQGAVYIWDAMVGRSVATIAGHPDTVSAVAFSPDGRHLASASTDGFHVWTVGHPA
jgi:hypothetical protein